MHEVRKGGSNPVWTDLSLRKKPVCEKKLKNEPLYQWYIERRWNKSQKHPTGKVDNDSIM